MVEVALVEVDWRAVKFCKVVEPVVRMLPNVPRELVVKLPTTVEEADERKPPVRYDRPEIVMAVEEA